MLQPRPSEIGSVRDLPGEPVRFMPHWFLVVRSLAPWFITLGACYGAVWALQFNAGAAAFARDAVPFVLLVLTVGFVYAVLRALILWRYAVVSVYDAHLVYRTGFLSTRTTTIEICEVVQQDVRQSLFQRLLGFGDLLIDSRASAILVIRAVANVSELQALIWDRRRLALARTGPQSSDAG